jgi:hypothetical protein
MKKNLKVSLSALEQIFHLDVLPARFHYTINIASLFFSITLQLFSLLMTILKKYASLSTHVTI